MNLIKRLLQQVGAPDFDNARVAVSYTEAEEWDRARVQHLILVQAVISRLANNEFLVKGWAITVAGVFFGFAANGRDSSIALVSIPTTMVFWGLDAYYLHCERRFRLLYARIQRREPVAMFDMSAMSRDEGESWLRRYRTVVGTMTRFPVAALYVTLIIVAGIVAALAPRLPASSASAPESPIPSISVSSPTPGGPTPEPSTSPPSAIPTPSPSRTTH